jgi:hypothetical protein
MKLRLVVFVKDSGRGRRNDIELGKLANFESSAMCALSRRLRRLSGKR